MPFGARGSRTPRGAHSSSTRSRPTRSISSRCERTDRPLLRDGSALLHRDAPVLHIHAVAVAVLAGREEVALALHHIAHDTAARLAVERDHRGEVFLLLRI